MTTNNNDNDKAVEDRKATEAPVLVSLAGLDPDSVKAHATYLFMVYRVLGEKKGPEDRDDIIDLLKDCDGWRRGDSSEEEVERLADELIAAFSK